MDTKISVAEYLEDNDLLEINYIPYEQKLEICNVVLEQCISEFEGYYSLNSALLERVQTEVFIENITNLDFSIKDEYGLGGYDQLCMYDELDKLIYSCGFLYEQFEDILDLMVYDYNNNVACTRGYLNTLKSNILNWISILKRDAHDFINNLDSKTITDNIVTVIKNAKKNIK